MRTRGSRPFAMRTGSHVPFLVLLAVIVGGVGYARLFGHLPSVVPDRYEFDVATSSSTSLPFTLGKDGLIVGTGLLSGHPVRFMLDTGNSSGVMLPTTASARELEVTGTGSLSDGMSRSSECNYVILPELRFGGYTVYDEIAASPAKGDFPRVREGKDLVGVGCAPFAHVSLTLDFRASRIELASTEVNEKTTHSPHSGLSFRWLPDQPGVGIPSVRGQIEGLDVTLGIDTGTSALAVSEKLGARLGRGRSRSRSKSTFGFSRVEVPVIRGLKGQIGNNHFVAEAAIIKGLPNGVDALIGTQFLTRFRVTFDFPGKRLYLDTPSR